MKPGISANVRRREQRWVIDEVYLGRWGWSQLTKALRPARASDVKPVWMRLRGHIRRELQLPRGQHEAR